jgi:hypothetical protein
VNGIGAASLRIARRGERIAAMDFAEAPTAPAPDLVSLARRAE